MKSSLSMGFYAIHPEAVDTIGEAFGWDLPKEKASFKKGAKEARVPSELLDVAVKNWPAIVELYASLEADRKVFENGLRDDLKAIVQKNGVSVIKGTRDPWYGGRVKFQLQDGRSAKAYEHATLGWDFETYGQSVLIQPWVWAKGRASETAISEMIEKSRSGNIYPKVGQLLGWSAGNVSLGEFRCETFLEDGALRIDDLRDRVLSCFRWVTPKRLERLATMGKKVRAA